MDYLDEVLSRLAACRQAGYHVTSETATEPAALTAIALLSHKRHDDAARWLDWLFDIQQANGLLGTTANEKSPWWATGWAAIAWCLARRTSATDRCDSAAINSACEGILSADAVLVNPGDILGHDASIPSWPWVDGTHSWVEPTAINVLALRITGRGDHPRALDGMRMLEDRLLPAGGLNYGNTTVLGQTLRPHTEPTGLALAALAGREDPTGRISRSIAWLEWEMDKPMGTASLCYGLMGLAAHGRFPNVGQDWLTSSAQKTLKRNPAAYPLALLALASLADGCPLIPQTEARSTP